ncbi:Nucleoside hydrolase [Penicillium argentinense]|uniref:Nucleoside hydrolase n=1 Tax=Penicillium argentinense TaxID=1131581 RepID=A0A9W9JVC3_9EURO|nr:Nucleoside hydrolase [Penicillium argentinense]KAJ5082517.1 Nucleoside hydrolase [Penicillium argentinense]
MARRIIIDTDPGIDDILALLLALSAKPEEVELLLISLTFGNIEVQNCLRNVVSMFHILERETQWRRENGRSEGFGTMRAFRPVVAVGAQDPLEDQKMLADYFHGTDGLGGIHASHPHLAPSQAWEHLFDPATDPNGIQSVRTGGDLGDHSFIPSKLPAYKEILRALRENEPDSVTLLWRPQRIPETFLRVKEVVVMGGAVNEPGNVSHIRKHPADPYPNLNQVENLQVTPVGEFNAYADAFAAARQLTLRLFPLDITLRHNISRGQFRKAVTPLLEKGSPLAEWVNAFMGHTFRTLERLHPGHVGDDAQLSLHDPVCVWYALTSEDPHWAPAPNSPEDIRIETTGQWTRGMCVVDHRNRHRIEGDEESSSDHGLWLSARAGNRIYRMDKSPAESNFGQVIIDKLFG